MLSSARKIRARLLSSGIFCCYQSCLFGITSFPTQITKCVSFETADKGEGWLCGLEQMVHCSFPHPSPSTCLYFETVLLFHPSWPWAQDPSISARVLQLQVCSGDHFYSLKDMSITPKIFLMPFVIQLPSLPTPTAESLICFLSPDTSYIMLLWNHTEVFS